MIAGAGTGKTQVITRRIAWLIATRRARPSEILALTFTDKAADEMQARVDQLVPYGYTDSAISTFHAFGDRLVREFALELGLPTDLRVLSRPEVVIFLRERLFAFELDEYRPLGDPTRFLSRPGDSLQPVQGRGRRTAGVLELRAETDGSRCGGGRRADAENRRADRGQCRAARSRRRPGDTASWPGVREVPVAPWRGGPDRLRRSGGPGLALAPRIGRRPGWSSSAVIRYVLVDEFQDTNRAQSELVELLAAPHGNVMVVGDDDQSIYKFRGAAISNILEFKRRHPRARQIVLRRNYRSRTPILDASYRLIRFNDPDRLEVRNGIDKRLVAERGAGDKAVRHLTFATGSEEADWVAREIAGRVAAGAQATRFRGSRARERGRGPGPSKPERGRACPGDSREPPGCMPGRRYGCSWRSCGPSRISRPAWTCTLWPRRRSMASAGPDLTAIVNSARRRNRSLWDVAEELTRQPGLLRLTR